MRLRKSNVSIQQLGIIVLLIACTLISGLADAQGFIHASKMWLNGELVLPEVFKSALGFGLGIASFWLCIRFLQDLRIISPEIQTAGWFTVAIIGVAIFSGKFLHWRIIEQIVGIAVILGIAWLLVRAGS